MSQDVLLIHSTVHKAAPPCRTYSKLNYSLAYIIREKETLELAYNTYSSVGTGLFVCALCTHSIKIHGPTTPTIDDRQFGSGWLCGTLTCFSSARQKYKKWAAILSIIVYLHEEVTAVDSLTHLTSRPLF